MTAYFLYLIEASICLGLLYLIYILLLKEDTFYKLNRFYLLGSIILSLIIPALPHSGLVKSIEQPLISSTLNYSKNDTHRDNFERVISNVIPGKKLVNKSTSNNFPVKQVIFIIYLIGAGLMFFRLWANFVSLLRIASSNNCGKTGQYRIVFLEDNLPSFSFFGVIFLNNKGLTKEEKHNILLHETTHLNQFHSLDIIFIEIHKIVFWFNPLAWQIKKSLIKIHECLADEAIVKSSPDKIESYQSILLHQYLSNFNIELAHPFNYSLIKFRIRMMTKTKSKWWAKYKIAFALPAVLMTLVAFTNQPSFQESKQEILRITKLYKVPDGWIHAGNNTKQFNVGFDIKEVQHGGKSAFLESTSENPYGFTTLMQSCNVLKFKGKRVRMTGYIKSEGVQDSAMMWARVDDYDKRIIADFDNMYNRPVVGKKDWTKCEIVFDVPESDCELFFGVILSGTGRVWFDNVSFEIVDNYINKTAFFSNSPLPQEYINRKNTGPNGLPEKLPINLDFEE